MFVTGKMQMLATSLLAVTGAIIYNVLGLEWMWAVTNILLALPFFMLGNWFSSYGRVDFESMFETLKASRVRTFSLFLLMLAITVAIGYLNGSALLFQGRYANSFLLFMIGALSGSFMVFLASVLLDKFDWSVVRITSMGTIVTLVFHRELLHSPLKMIRRADWDVVSKDVAMFFLSVAVLLAFIPIILIGKRILPIVFGKRAKSI